ncbi:MAG: Gfo/Idh/MocA family oxidoreductase [Deltaproteobacteria bacterium]|jgi:predicted dehydrogenase|nr:Gfo/Idh/MocA family oxidoreductase [Deltaproteobacteria bacterium]
MLKIGIIGCGRVADQHVTEILKIRNCEIVGVCDKEILMAKQLQERINVGRYFSDVDKLFELKPDIIHITTPPQSHFELGKRCLESGSSILVEKPFTLNVSEAKQLIEIAEKLDLKVTVGHNIQFSNAANRLRNIIKSGYLGGTPVHIESLWCHEHSNDYINDKNHWIRFLPGKIVHDLISHGVAIIAEFMNCDNPKVVAHGHVSPILRNMNEESMVDEIRVHIYDNDNVTAHYIFSSQIRPIIKQFRIFGPKKSLIMDHEHQTVIEFTSNYKYYLNHFIPPLIDAKQHLGNFINNIVKFMKREHYYEAGRKYLIECFYRSVADNTPVPIPYKQIVLTHKIIDDIFNQIY